MGGIYLRAPERTNLNFLSAEQAKNDMSFYPCGFHRFLVGGLPNLFRVKNVG